MEADRRLATGSTEVERLSEEGPSDERRRLSRMLDCQCGPWHKYLLTLRQPSSQRCSDHLEHSTTEWQSYQLDVSVK